MDSDYLNPASLDRAYQLARRAMQLDPSLPQAHAENARILARMSEHAAAIAEFEWAVVLNPNFTDWRFAGRRREPPRPSSNICAWIRSMYLWHPDSRACPRYAQKIFASAAAILVRQISEPATSGWPLHMSELGSCAEATAEAAEVLRIERKWTIEGPQVLLSAFRRTRTRSTISTACARP